MINKRRAYTARIHFWTAGLIIGVGMTAFSLRAEEGIPPVEAAEIGKTGNVHRAGEIYFGAQPGVEDLKEAKGKGLQTIVSLRHPGELDFDERKEVESLGMKYIAHPWNGEEELTDEIFDAVRATLQTAPRPLLLHCGSSNRAGAVWLAARALDQGVELEKAVEDAKLVGLKKEAYEEKARAYIATRRKAESSLSDQQKEDIRKLGSQAAASLMKQLSGQLKAAMSAGGPVAAVGVCKSVALPITKAAGDEMKGVEIGRTSLKTRNPQNQPDAVDRTVLEKWLTETPGEEIVSIHENAVRYYKPVVVQAVCLKCHGGMDSMDEKLVQLLAQTYPDDQATGYKEGDLRGAIRVKIDLKQALQQ